MYEQKGIGYCGLACAVCGDISCVGCRNDGCSNKDWCKNFMCCNEKGLKGCWECEQFPCEGGMLDKIRIRTFATFIKEYGKDALLKCLERNEKSGIVYHYDGQIIGDYDVHKTEEEIIHMIKFGL